MIPQKIIDITERAGGEYLKENTIYEAKDVLYGFAQRIIEITLNEAMMAVDRADIRGKTYTTFDKGMIEFCKEQVRRELIKIMEEVKVEK